jgi:hypothetical protein
MSWSCNNNLLNPAVAWVDHAIIIHVSWQYDFPWCYHETCNNNLHEVAVWFSLIRLRKNGLPLVRPILCFRKFVCCLESGLVSKFASWSFVWTWRTVREFFWTRSRTKCKSIWMCFMRECWTRLNWLHQDCHMRAAEAEEEKTLFQ